MSVLTWWRVTNNGPAASLVDAAEAQPGVGKVNLLERDTKGAMMATVESLLLGAEGTEPVDTFLANAGPDILRWTPCGGEGQPERLLRLDGDDAYPDLRSRFDPAVLGGVTCCAAGDDCNQPGIYALPLGLHQINYIFFNVERFDRCPDLQVRDAESLIALLSCLGRDGERVISMPVSDCAMACELGEPACSTCRAPAGESLSYLLESLALLIAEEPLDSQSRWSAQRWRDTDAARLAPPLHDALALLEGELLPFLNDCGKPPCPAVPADAAEALLQVKEGAAAFMVMPDWYTLDAQRTSHGAIGHGPFPGTADTLLFMADVFALPLAGTPGASVEAGFRWLDTLLDLEVQRTFARRKTALAAREDHSQRRLLPSLETMLPVNADPAQLRASLDQWLQTLSPPPVPARDASRTVAPELGDGQLPLPVAPCASSPCLAP